MGKKRKNKELVGITLIEGYPVYRVNGEYWVWECGSPSYPLFPNPEQIIQRLPMAIDYEEGYTLFSDDERVPEIRTFSIVWSNGKGGIFGGIREDPIITVEGEIITLYRQI